MTYEPPNQPGYGYNPPQQQGANPVPPAPPMPPSSGQYPASYGPGGQYPQQGGYSPAPGSTPPAKVPTRTAPALVTIAGALIGIVGFVVIIVGSISGFGSLVNDLSSHERLSSGNTYSITTAPNTSYGIFIESNASISCRAVNSGGSSVPISVPFGESHANDLFQVLVMETGPADTTVEITCDTSDGSAYFIGKSVGSSLGGIAGSAFGGAALMGVGFLIFVGGLIWLLVRGSAIKRARASTLYQR